MNQQHLNRNISILPLDQSIQIKQTRFKNHQFPMQTNTISVSPIPESTTVQRIKQIFVAFSVKNVHIEGKTAYVEFKDQGDLQTLEIQFDNYEVAELNNAKIDKTQFDWSSVKKDNVLSPDNKSSSSGHQDLMAADIENLVVVQHCDQNLLNSLSVEKIKNIFRDFHSVNRIVKRRNQVIVEFTDAGQMEMLENKFHNFNVPQLGNHAQIQKADSSKITADDFVSQWQKSHNNEFMSEASTNLGYKDEKQTPGEAVSGDQLGYGSMEQKPSHNVLHDDIIPSFDKKTSMEVNFLNEQSQMGQKKEEQHEVIPQATTHQELDYTTQVKLPGDQHKLGYNYDAQTQRHSEEEKEKQQKRIKQEDEAHRREEQQRKHQEERQQRQKEEKLKKEEEERHRREYEQNQRKQEEAAQKHRRQEEQRRRKEEQERQQKHRREEEQRIVKEEEQRRKRQQDQRQRVKEQQEKARKLKQEEERKRREQERLSKQLKDKLDSQREKFEKQHHVPTESENVAKQVETLKQAGQSIEKQIGQAVNKAKQESAHLLETGLNLLKGSGQKTEQKGKKEQKREELKSKSAKLGYEEQNPKEIGLNLINSGLEFVKGTYTKFQEHFGEQASKQRQALGSPSVSFEQKPSAAGYESWSVKPDVSLIKPVVEGQSRVLKTLITVTLLIWVIFLLMQDTSSFIPSSEIQIPTPNV